VTILVTIIFPRSFLLHEVSWLLLTITVHIVGLLTCFYVDFSYFMNLV